MDDTILQTLHSLYQTYETNDYAREKLISYLKHAPEYVVQQLQEKKERDERRELLEHYRIEFLKKFTQTNNYLYIPDSSLFVKYDSENYSIVQEDVIWGQILSTITQEKHLIPWKQKVRMELLATIRKNMLTRTIPESSTIQRVLRILSTSIVPNKDYAKYFLTILGDAILRKPSTNVYLTDAKIMKFVDFLQYYLNKFVKNNISTLFKTKYHNHEYKDLRMFPLHENIDMPFLWEHLIKENALNIVAVACHYSNRYDYADNFIEQCSNQTIRNYVFALRNETKETVVSAFKTNMLQESSLLSMTQQEMLYSWKEYLKQSNLQPIMFHKEFIDIMKTMFEVNDHGDFVNVTCDSIQYVKQFNTFMENTMQTNVCMDSTQDHMSDEGMALPFTVYQYEVSELIKLYELWSKEQSNESVVVKHGFIDEVQCVNLIQHFFDSISIEENRYILDCKNLLWDKYNEVLEYLHEHNHHTDSNNETNYENYCAYAKTKNVKTGLCVSKEYFDHVFMHFFTPV